MNHLAVANPPTPIFFGISSDASDYVYTDNDNEEDIYDERIVMSTEEKEEVEYLSIFHNNYDNADEEIMTVENVGELKNLGETMMERTGKGDYRYKIQYERFYNECMLAYAKYCKP